MASGLGIAFCGNSVRATSVVLDADVCQPADVEKCLQRLSVAGTPAPGKSVGLMFACVGRGRYFYDGAVGVESTVFKRLYPRVPLFGFFGNGEIGYDCPLASNSRCFSFTDGTLTAGASHGDGTVVPKIYHSYSSIFVLLSFLS